MAYRAAKLSWSSVDLSRQYTIETWPRWIMQYRIRPGVYWALYTPWFGWNLFIHSPESQRFCGFITGLELFWKRNPVPREGDDIFLRNRSRLWAIRRLC